VGERTQEPNENTHGLLPPSADHGEHFLIGALLCCSSKSDLILASIEEGECLRSARLRLIYRACRTIMAEGRQPDPASVLDWLQNHGRDGEAGGGPFLASLVEIYSTEALVEQHCAEVQRACRGRRTDEALLVGRQRLAAGENPDLVTAELSDMLSNLPGDRESNALNVRSAWELLNEGVPPVKWVVERVIPSGGLGMITGEGGVGKTWLILELALSVASGTPWLGTFPTTKGHVLYVDEESDTALLQDRLLKLRDLQQFPELPISFSTLEGLRVDTDKSIGKLRETIRKTGAKLVVIDCFVRIHELDENDSGQMSRVLKALSVMARKYDCAIVVVHHARKPGPGSNEPSHRVRGASAIRDAVDANLLVSRDKTGATRIEHEKARFGPAVEPLLVRLVKEGERQLRLAAVKEAVAKLEEARRFIAEQVKAATQPVLGRDLRKAASKKGIRSRTLAQGLSELIRDGKLEVSTQTERTEKGGTRVLKAYRWKGKVLQ
jgi:KaiC/GvpD/RAD55 family RecA-like ATPase